MVEGWSWRKPLYFSVTAAATVSMGKLPARTGPGKLFTVVSLFIPLAIFACSFMRVVSELVKGQFERAAKCGSSHAPTGSG